MDIRQPKAFALWFRPVGSAQRRSAWMLDVSAGGAAFLTTPEELPALGTRIELFEMQTGDRLVRHNADGLPQYARVLRHDMTGGCTRRVAVQFEEEANDHLAAPDVQPTATSRPISWVCPQPPPIPDPRRTIQNHELAKS